METQKYYFYCVETNTAFTVELSLFASVYGSDLILHNGIFYEIGQQIHNAHTLFDVEPLLHEKAFIVFPKAKESLKPFGRTE